MYYTYRRNATIYLLYIIIQINKKKSEIKTKYKLHNNKILIYLCFLLLLITLILFNLILFSNYRPVL